MHALKYNLLGERGQAFQRFHNVSLPEIEWFYGEEEIGLFGWPEPLQHCFLRHLWPENYSKSSHERDFGAIVVEKSIDREHDVIRREKEEGGFMGGPAYGIDEVFTLVNFLESTETVHIYRAHLSGSPQDNNLTVFSRNPPNRQLYRIQNFIKVIIKDHNKGKLLLEELVNRSNAIFPLKENQRKLVLSE